jgi:hypothetical protein
MAETMGVTFAAHNVEEIKLHEPRYFGSANKFWVQKIELVGVEGETAIINVFGHKGNKIKVVT